MAHFHSTGHTGGQPAWRPADGYSPVDQRNEKQQVSVSYSEQTRSLPRKESFRPLPHRTVPLLCLATIVLALIGAIEYGLRVLPSTPIDVPATTSNTTIAKRQDIPANDGTLPAVPTAPAAITVPDDVTITEVPPSTSFLQAAATTFEGIIEPTTATSAYINAEATTVTSVPTANVVASVAGTWSAGTEPIANPAIENTGTATSVAPEASVGTNSVTMHSGSTTAIPTAGLVTESSPDGGSTKEPILHSNVPLTLVKNPSNYFLSIYAPVLVSVLLRLVVGYLFRSTKLVDPFFMLSEDEGSPFPLWDDHVGCETVFAPWFAIKNRRWLLLWTSLAYAAAQLLTPFSSELTAIHLGMYQLPNGYVRGHSIWINPIIARLLEALLGTVFVLIAVSWAMLRRTRSNVRTNPASIASIASLVGHPTTAQDLCFNQWADKSTTAKLFEGRRYRLESYMANGSECYGIVPVGQIPPLTHDSADFHAPVSRSVAHKDSINLFLVTASAAVLFGIILAYLKSSTSTSLERFMDSQTFGPRFLLSALGLLLKSPLLALCARTAASVPFCRLAVRPRREAEITKPVPITPQGAIGYTFKRQAWFAAGVAVASGFLIEVLLILLPGVPFNAQLSWNAALASWYGSLTCLGLILLVTVLGWVRLFRNSNEWPKSPTTVGAVAMYVSGTSLSMDRSAADGGFAPSRRTYYDFGMRDGRWTIDYSSRGSGDWATTGHQVRSEQPVVPSLGPRGSTHDNYDLPSPSPTRAAHYSAEESPQRANAYDAYRPPQQSHHLRATSHGEHYPSHSDMAPPLRGERNSVPDTGTYPGRPQYSG